MNHELVLVIALAVILVAALVWQSLTTRRLSRLEQRLDALIGDTATPNTTQMLAECLATVRRTDLAVSDLQQHQRQVEQWLPRTIRHVGLVRFSPFHDTGGDQSFALALLDGRGDGVVVTALHSRTDSRLYAKPIEQHQSTYTLTPEEREAMARAVGAPLEAAHT
ncbi:MAG TPA: DUF4446 family protein [Chloroflexota bacterium]|nr:DUF4446 family protein [Chloroflexota bacterium]